MTELPLRHPFSRFAAMVCGFGNDEGGNVAILFGLTMIVALSAMGAGLDLSRAYLARQKLSQVATLACQYASRPAVVETSTASYNGSNGGTTYVSQVDAFINTTWQSQNINLTQTNGTPFAYTQGGAATVSLSASVPTTFMEIAGFTKIPIAVQTHCFDSPAAVEQRVADSNSQYMIKESFEAAPSTGGTAVYMTMPNGVTLAKNANSTNSSSTAYTGTVGYTGLGGTQWYIIGYCLEQDSNGTIKSSVYDGNYSVELDCDNGHGTAGNSSITTLIYLPAGSYELRYAYASRVLYPLYDPTYICGSAASDVSWATSTTTSTANNSTYSTWSGASALRTNEINVYLDPNTNNSPPTHTTLDGTQQLAGSNLIDVCLYGPNWIQRSVALTVTTPGYYWLSFAADGGSDAFGGQLDDILLCRVSCPGSVQDNFPPAWASSKLLFEDTFESMTVKSSHGTTADTDITTSYGSSGTSSSGWPYASASGWPIAQVNEANTNAYQPIQGAVSVELDADANWGGIANSNRTISRPLLLVPGYYKVSYYYRANVTFASLGSNVSCGATPSAAGVNALTGTGTGNTASSGGGNQTFAYDTNMVGTFMSHALMASNPNIVGYGSDTTYANPDGTTSSSPTVPDNTLSLTSYNSAQVNPLLDICGYAGTWQSRTANVFIEKSAFYWLTFAALGTADAYGGVIDDVKITALGSPYMSSPPSAVTIPVPNPQPGSSISYSGFSLVADPLTP